MIRRLAPHASRLRRSRFVQNSGWMLAGQGLRIVVQAVYFVIIARALGASQYGGFVGVAALIAVLAPFATWGAGNVMIKNVARRPSTFQHFWGAALHATALSAGILGVVAWAAARLVLSQTVPTVLVVEIIVADLLFARLVDLGGQAFQAHDRLSRTATTQFAISAIRLVAALLLATLVPGRATASQWGALYLAASAVSAAVTLYWAFRELGFPDWAARLTRPQLAEGFHFSVTNSAASIYADIDKTMLARMATLEAAGFYAAAYRILDVSFVPIRSILFAAYGRFFSAGESGVRGAIRYARKLVAAGVVYSVFAALAIYALAPIVPRFLGPEYARSVIVLQMLCVLPLLRTLHYFAADALTGADRQGLRSGVQAVIAVGNVLLNLVLIPRYTWRGAVWSSIASDGMLAACLWVAVAVLSARERSASPAASPTVLDPSPPAGGNSIQYESAPVSVFPLGS